MGFYLSGKDAIQRIREREKQIEAKIAARGSGRGRKRGSSRKSDSGGPVSTTDAVCNFHAFKKNLTNSQKPTDSTGSPLSPNPQPLGISSDEDSISQSSESESED